MSVQVFAHINKFNELIICLTRRVALDMRRVLPSMSRDTTLSDARRHSYSTP